jgi:hypothetical protein
MKAGCGGRSQAKRHYCTCTVRIVNTRCFDGALFAHGGPAGVTVAQQMENIQKSCCGAA